MISCKYLVIGSGPAAIAATKAIVAAGERATVVDVGRDLPKSKQDIVSRMSIKTPTEWTPEDFSLISRLDERKSDEPINLKASYGSHYSYNESDDLLDIDWQATDPFKYSFAKGGLTNVWGSALLPHSSHDIHDWPISVDDLEPHYRAVMNFVPSTAISDGLVDILPTYSDQNNALEPSRQGASFLSQLGKNKKALNARGIRFGRSRLAIQAKSPTKEMGCYFCGLCLSGCPYGLIYSSKHTLNELRRDDQIDYYDDHFVEKFEQIDGNVIVTGKIASSQETFTIKTSRAFLGAGVLPTASIVMNSVEHSAAKLKLKDSQYFIYPIMRFRGMRDVEDERLHTSSQAFLEIKDSKVSQHLVHLQVYGYSSFLVNELEKTPLKMLLKMSWFRKFFFGRLLIVQGFIHSAESGSLELSFQRKADGLSAMTVRAKRSFRTILKVWRVGLKLTASCRRLGAVPLLPGLKVMPPGHSYHTGGSFPMAADPQSDFQTDVLGRLSKFPNVHLVDSSVHPSIPATTITMSSMANAHRIATEAVALDR